MSRTPTHHRVFALVLATTFLLLSIASGILVLWQLREDNRAAENESAIVDQLDGADQSSQQTNQQNEGDVLEGTKLADFTPGSPVPSLQIIDLVEGSGQAVSATDTITAHYTGALVSDGTIFQSSLDSGQPFTSPLSNLIQGWQEGIPGMKPGGTRRLVIPAAQAYGDRSQPGIPANSDLVFDIQLISIESQ